MYGNPESLPVEEEAPHDPANVYGKSKAEAEDVITGHIAEATKAGTKINAIMLRLSNVYGSAKDHPERLIPAIMRNALSNRPIQMVGGDQDVSSSPFQTPPLLQLMGRSSTWCSWKTSSTPSRSQ